MAHVRRKFFELHQSGKSHIAEQALKSIAQLYAIEASGADLTPAERRLKYVFRLLSICIVVAFGH